ncbi:EsaB/YukD family protein [Microbacterium sp. NPDC008134]|uniref:EsaB/YukD family protein n=1 Tax=Microbacterium sp. NPDC008134 TaxID=3364183 RepID=UPI0036E3283B
MSDFTRLSVRGASRRAEIAVSSDDPLGILLPHLIDALAEPAGADARPLALVTAMGDSLDLERSAREQDLGDGSVLHLIPFDSAPPPPMVIDVVDVVADELDGRHDRWSEASRVVVSAVGVALCAATVSIAVPLTGPAGIAARFGFLGVLVVFAVGFGLLGRSRIATVLATAAIGAGIPAATQMADARAAQHPMSVMPSAALWIVLVCSGVLVLAVGVARRSRGAMVGGALGIALSAPLITALAAGMPQAQATAVIGVIAALLVGLVPWIALSASGLTGLDHRVAENADLPRPAALDAVSEAYRTLDGVVAVLGVMTAFCGIVLWMSGGVWARLLAVVLALVLMLRSRAFPLRAQGFLLWAAAMGITGGAAATLILQDSLGWVAAAGAVVIGTVAATAGLARPRAHQRARLRSFGDALETAAVVATVPLAVGVFGIYADLLALFGGGA